MKTTFQVCLFASSILVTSCKKNLYLFCSDENKSIHEKNQLTITDNTKITNNQERLRDEIAKLNHENEKLDSAIVHITKKQK